MAKFWQKSVFVLTLALVFSLAAGSLAQAEDFPLRTKYPDVVPISTEELAASLNDVIVVDARNKTEYSVIHIKGAHNFLVGKMKESDLLSLRGKNDEKLIVFYCNGITCSKSYKAATKAAKFGFKNVRAYDAGIFNWSKTNPEKAMLFDKALNSETVKEFIAQRAKAKALALPTAEFIAKVKAGYTLIDIRDKNEAQEKPIDIKGKKNISFDTVVKLMEQDKPVIPKSKIAILDNVGKQVTWLYFYLVKYGRTDVYFLKGGVKAWMQEGYDKQGNKK